MIINHQHFIIKSDVLVQKVHYKALTAVSAQKETMERLKILIWRAAINVIPTEKSFCTSHGNVLMSAFLRLD